jgi:hypothetical protein
MGLLEGKSWLAQDFYNEYLKMKVDISESIKSLDYCKLRDVLTEEVIKAREEKIAEKVARLKVILNHLKLSGVSMEDLILLSIGVDV